MAYKTDKWKELDKMYIIFFLRSLKKDTESVGLMLYSLKGKLKYINKNPKNNK